MTTARFVLAFFLSIFMTISASSAAVSSSRQACIRGAMEAGSAALDDPSQLSRLFERYFAAEKIAQLTAGKNWKRYNSAQKDAQRDRVRRAVVYTLAQSFARYRGSRVKFLNESGSKVKGIVTAPNGERSTITWHFAGACKFVNVSIEGYGSLISVVGRVPTGK